jgi:hypothetical protein
MAGELVPLVMIPRFTTYAASGTYSTIAMDVTEYQNAILNVWRNAGVGTAPTFGIKFEESTDQVSWSVCSVTPSGGPNYDPGADSEGQYIAALKKRWFRVSIILGGTGAVVMCWAVGFLEQRER